MKNNNPIERDMPLRLVALFAVGVFVIAGCAQSANSILLSYYNQESSYYSEPYNPQSQTVYPGQASVDQQFFVQQ